MKNVDLEKPFRLTLDFWIAFSVLAVPVLWLTKPWTWALPVISRVAGLIFLPFAAAIVCYCPFLFLRAITQGSSKEKKIGLAFLAATIGAALFLTLVWKLYGFEAVPSLFAIPAVLIANAVFAYVHTQTPNQAPEPTSGRSLNIRQKMKTGRIVSLEPSPKRDVEVRITTTELFSAVSDPPGTISADAVAGYEIAEERSAGTYSFRLYVLLVGGSRVLFYTGADQFDLALLLDEFEAALPDVPRSRTKA